MAGDTRTATSRRSRSGTSPGWPRRCCRSSTADVDRAVERAKASLDRFPDLFEQHWLDGMRAKLGLFTQEDGDKSLVAELLAWMQRRSADFTNTFRSLTSGRLVEDAATPIPKSRRGIGAWWRAADGSRSRPPKPRR